jgi:hypothetical protein
VAARCAPSLCDIEDLLAELCESYRFIMKLFFTLKSNISRPADGSAGRGAPGDFSRAQRLFESIAGPLQKISQAQKIKSVRR